MLKMQEIDCLSMFYKPLFATTTNMLAWHLPLVLTKPVTSTVTFTHAQNA